MPLPFIDGQVPVSADFNDLLDAATSAANTATSKANEAAISAAEAAENGGGAKIGEVNVFTKNQSVTSALLVSGASIPVNASLSNNFRLTIAHDGILENPTNPWPFTRPQSCCPGRGAWSM